MLLHRLDNYRITRRLQRAENRLRLVDAAHLTPEVYTARADHLDRLAVYRLRGVFPQRTAHPALFAPCFIDSEGRACAVADLMIASGQTALAKQVMKTHNYARIQAMHLPELTGWVKQSGLQVDELAQIQPGYPLKELLLVIAGLSVLTLPISILLLLAGVGIVQIDFFGIRSLPMWCVLPWFGFGVLTLYVVVMGRYQDGRADKRMAYLQNLEGTGATAELIKALDDPYWKISYMAAKRLEQIGISAVPDLLLQLSDGSTHKRLMTIQTLGNIGDPRAVSALIPLLNETDPSIYGWTVRALITIGTAEAVAPLINQLGSENMERRRHTEQDLSRLKKHPLPLLLETLRHPDPQVRYSMARVVGRLNLNEAVPTLIEMLSDQTLTRYEMPSGQTGVPPTRRPVSEAASHALEWIKTPEALAALEQWNQSKENR